MEPIISPWVFYLIGVVDKLHTALVVFMGMCVCVFVLAGLGYKELYATEEEQARCVKTATIAGVLFLVAGIVEIFIPDATALYKMLTASYLTPDTIGTAQNNVVDFVGKIAEQLAKVNK